MKIIFLDIDGVLNRLGSIEESRTTTRWNGFIGMDPELVSRFNKVLAHTRARIVLSSTWRLDPDWLETMRKNGINGRKFLGRTPSLDSRFRGDEIKRWLENYNILVDAGGTYPAIEKYAILDDDSDFYEEQPLFKTSYKTGLTEEIANAVVEYLTFKS